MSDPGRDGILYLGNKSSLKHPIKGGIMGDYYHQELYPGGIFHIYNQGNNGQRIFYTTANYQYFLRKFHEYLHPYLSIYAYCLIPNHFHFLARVKEIKDAGKIATEQFRRLFITYAQAINKREHRSGSLFRKNFNRIAVETDSHFYDLVFYIHNNPVHHGLVADFRKYPWSSYSVIANNAPGIVDQNGILQWFDSRGDFIRFHEEFRDLRSRPMVFEE